MANEQWTRTEGLYHAALLLPVAERDAFLAEACPDDEPLRHDVQSLLNEPVEDAFLSGPALVTPELLVAHLTAAQLSGRTLGGYRLEALLGAGGMGDVYRARDTALERDVAIKILPPAFTTNPDRLARFEREARLLAAMNHPNICAIHGLEEAEGLRFLVLEFLNGKTLADTLAAASRTPSAVLPLEDALAIAQQIAAALEAAHDRGIIHRDLKPANIIITTSGVVKVLDFGLGKAITSEGHTGDHGQARTRGSTVVGVLMGTADYMSAEQASGKAVDRRTDIWAFGAVLFEMVTGRPPFAGETINETLASVVKSEPEWSAVPLSVTPDLRRLLRRCLQKDPKRRLQSMGDARVQIEDLTSGVSLDPVAVSPPRTRRERAVPWIVAGVLASGLVGTLGWSFRTTALPVTRLGFVLPAGQRLDGSGGGHILAVSPDGARIAFIASPPAIYLRSMSRDDVKAIPGSEGHRVVRQPVFSPDGGAIAYYADQTLKRITVEGGVPVTICPAKTPYGLSWGPDGIVFGQGEGIMRVSPNGGPPVRIVSTRPDETAHGPQLLPGGQQVLFTLATGATPDKWDKARIVVQSLGSGERTTVVNGGSDARYVPTGHIVYALGGRLFAVAFDLRDLKVQGDPVSIVEGVRRGAANWTGTANVSLSNNGSLIYVPGPVSPPDALMDVAMIDRTTGSVEVLNLPPRRYASPRVSPDGKRLAVATEDGMEAAVWTYELSGTMPMQRLTIGGNNRFPIWTSSTSVAFQSDRDGDLGIFRQAPGTPAERVTKPEERVAHAPESWSEKTNTLLFSIANGSDLSLWALSLNDGKRTHFTAVSPSSATYASGAVFSPDGQWVAYGSAERGATTIYVQPFPATGARYQLDPKGSDGPHEPVWSRDGQELFYNPRLGGFEVVSVTSQPTFAFGSRRPLARKFQMGPPGARTNYDITPSGVFVGLITSGRTHFDAGSDDRIEVVLNWLEDVKTRLPGR